MIGANPSGPNTEASPDWVTIAVTRGSPQLGHSPFYHLNSDTIWIDGVKKWESGNVTRDIPAIWVDLDVSGAKKLELVVRDCGDIAGDHADWAEARLLTGGGR